MSIFLITYISVKHHLKASTILQKLTAYTLTCSLQHLVPLSEGGGYAEG